ncbi:hypothetical protein COE51_11075 [Bacillus pseudomycoides]|nr:hypothetical protein COE51_11075 [Bacillus pseudomycoides]
MNLSIFDELELFSKELQRYMSPDALEQLAKNVGFVKQKKERMFLFRFFFIKGPSCMLNYLEKR